MNWCSVLIAGVLRCQGSSASLNISTAHEEVLLSPHLSVRIGTEIGVTRTPKMSLRKTCFFFESHGLRTHERFWWWCYLLIQPVAHRVWCTYTHKVLETLLELLILDETLLRVHSHHEVLRLKRLPLLLGLWSHMNLGWSWSKVHVTLSQNRLLILHGLTRLSVDWGQRLLFSWGCSIVGLFDDVMHLVLLSLKLVWVEVIRRSVICSRYPVSYTHFLWK